MYASSLYCITRKKPSRPIVGLLGLVTFPASMGLCTDPSRKATFLLVSWPFCTSMLVGGREKDLSKSSYEESTSALRGSLSDLVLV